MAFILFVVRTKLRVEKLSPVNFEKNDQSVREVSQLLKSSKAAVSEIVNFWTILQNHR